MVGGAVAAIFSGGLSLAFELVPGLKAAWAKVPANRKPLAVLVVCMLIPFGIAFLGCYGINLGYGAVCDWSAQRIAELITAGVGGFFAASASYKFVGESLGNNVRAFEAANYYFDDIESDKKL